MKFTCEKNLLLKEITIAQEIISSRNILSILSNILLVVSNNTLTIKATDLKVAVETKIPVDVSLPGSTTIYCDKFLGILKALPEGEVEIELVENNLKIKPLFKKIDFTLKSTASDKFPEIRDINSNKYFELPQKEFIEMISQTIFAVSDDETRYFMNGVYLEKKENELAMVATDGRRLSFIKKSFEKMNTNFESIIIPPKILIIIRRLSSGEGNFSIAIDEKNIFIKFDNHKLSSFLIEGQFPNYQRVIPEKQEYEMKVKKEAFFEALRRVSLLVEQKSRRIFMGVEKNILTLTSEESDIGMAREEIECSFNGEKTTIALNYLYVSEPLKVIDGKEISIKFSESNTAISIEPIPKKNYFHIIMPMQLD